MLKNTLSSGGFLQHKLEIAFSGSIMITNVTGLTTIDQVIMTQNSYVETGGSMTTATQAWQ